MCAHETEDGKCRKFSDETVASYCVQGPCEYDTPSNYGRMKEMSVEEMARLFTHAAADGCPPSMDWNCEKDTDGWDACDICWARWLNSPAEGGAE